MEKILIAFDVDGTLRSGYHDTPNPTPNENIRALLVILSQFKNVEIMVWSGGGELYARQVSQAIGISQYVHKYASKNVTQEDPMGIKTHSINPDIAIDDMEGCELGIINLICKEK